MSRAAAELQQDVAGLARTVTEIAHALRSAERRIEDDARERVGTLRRRAREQLAVLYGHHADARRLVAQLGDAGGDAVEIREAARRAVSNARATADAMIAGLRGVVLG